MQPAFSQLKGMLRFHKSAYKAYKSTGNKSMATQARRIMIETYLKIRGMR